ncbi:hypothetical protein WJX82_000329 [Trebouxia sp. C0006]
MGERASSAIQTAHYIDSAEGTMSDPMHSTPWDEMSVAVLHSVAALLDWSSKQEVRLVCKAWKQAATLAINTLRPNMTGSLGLQWHNLHQLSKAFPACRVLDLRSYRVPRLGYIAQLTTLVELSVTCCEDIDDTHMRLLSALTNLEELRLGPLKGCTSAGGSASCIAVLFTF